MLTEYKVPTVEKVIAGVVVNVPVGSLDRPSEMAEKWFRSHENPENWKLPPKTFITTSIDSANEYAYALDWYLGGHEITEGNSVYGGTKLWIVTSKGYYHYIGA